MALHGLATSLVARDPHRRVNSVEKKAAASVVEAAAVAWECDASSELESKLSKFGVGIIADGALQTLRPVRAEQRRQESERCT